MRIITLSPQPDAKVPSSSCATNIGLDFNYPKLIPLRVYRISFEKLERRTYLVNLPVITLLSDKINLNMENSAVP